MFALLPSIIPTVTGLLFAGAAFVSSIGFFKSSGRPAPQTGMINGFQIGKLIIMGFGLLLGYKLIKDVF